MKNLVFIFLIVLSLDVMSQKVYDATNDSTATVHLRFIETADSAEADIWVCYVDSISKVYKDGQWYSAGNSLESQFNFIMTADENIADFKIYFVTNPRNAGWRKPNKRYLYTYARRRNH